jgi:predicted MPP superfamily phosphohydrolase
LRRFPPAFLAVVIGVLTTLHLFVWWRLAAPLPAPIPLVGGAIVGLGAVAILGTLIARVRRIKLPALPRDVAFAWLGVVFLAFTGSIAAEPVRWGLAFAGFDPLALSGGVLATVLAVAAYGWVRARRPDVVRVPVPIAGLHPGVEGLRIVQISDLHVGHTTRAFLDEVVDTINGLAPDVVAITGDLVEGTIDEVAADLAPLRRLTARHGVFFVTGNHEYFVDGPAWAAHLPDLGIRVLRNERVTLEREGGAVLLAGVDDLFGARFPGHGPDLAGALAGRDPQIPVVLLSHQPVTVDDAARHGVALQLSGHTHGGQIWPFGWLVRLQQPYLSGLVRHGPTWLYVHRGTGHWGPPLRVGAPPEIAVLELQAV